MFVCVSSWWLFASFLVSLISVLKFGSHHGGRMYASIVSVRSVMCGNWCRAFSKFDWYVIWVVLSLSAFASHACRGCLVESDLIREIDFRTLAWRRRAGGSNSAWISIAAMGVVL